MKNRLLYGTLILFIASLFNRIVGFIYQIWLIDLIGAEGIGLFNMAVPIYILAVVMSTAGLPVAISKYVAAEKAKGNLKSAYRIFFISLGFLAFSGLTATILLYWALPLIQTYIFPNPKAIIIFKALIPAILVVTLCSAFRGFFQGLLDMIPTAVTQVVEQLVRVSLGLTLASMYCAKGIEYGAKGAAIGTVCGEIIGFCIMLIMFFKRRPKNTGNKKSHIRKREILHDLLTLSIPVTLTRVVATVVLSLEASIIPTQLLLSGLSINEATTLYGQLTAMGITILVLPSVLTTSLSTALIPAVSEASEVNNQQMLQERIIESLRLTIVTGIPAVTIFYTVPFQITDLLYKTPEAGHILKILAFGGVFYYLQQTTSAILQGLNRANIPLQNLLIATILELIGLYTLVRIPSLNILGAAWAVNISFVVFALLNLTYIVKLLKVNLRTVLNIAKIFVMSLIMGILLRIAYKGLFVFSGSNGFSLLTSVLFSLLCYLLLAYFSGIIRNQDLKRLPYSSKLKKVLTYLFHLKR